jgi:predicted component of type VI protein secretion system
LPKEDPEFVPPCLLLGGSRVLREMVRDLVAQVEASRKELVVQVSRGGFSIDTMRGVQFEQVIRLRTLIRYSGRLPSMVQAGAVTPFQMYLELRELLGELARCIGPRRIPVPTTTTTTRSSVSGISTKSLRICAAR